MISWNAPGGFNFVIYIGYMVLLKISSIKIVVTYEYVVHKTLHKTLLLILYWELSYIFYSNLWDSLTSTLVKINHCIFTACFAPMYSTHSVLTKKNSWGLYKKCFQMRGLKYSSFLTIKRCFSKKWRYEIAWYLSILPRPDDKALFTMWKI